METSYHNNSNETTSLPVVIENKPLDMSHGYIFDKLLNILSLKLPNEIQVEHLDCKTVAGIIDNYVLGEVKVLSDPITKVSMHSMSYDAIQQATATINIKKEFYYSVVTKCNELYTNAPITTQDDHVFLSCPVDQTLEIDKDGLWIKNLDAPMLVGIRDITSTWDLVKTIRCKFFYLSTICDRILGIRIQYSNSAEKCYANFSEYSETNKELIMTSAQRELDGAEYFSTTTTKKEKFQAKVINRLKRNRLFEKFTDFIFNQPAFAYFVSNTEGVTNNTVADFLIDNEILRRIGTAVLQYPWLKELYHKRLTQIQDMLVDAYKTCVSQGFKLSPTQAYITLWYWVVKHLQIGISGIDNGILMFTELMNRITGASVLSSTMPKEISRNKKRDYSDFFFMLDVSAMKYGIMNPQRQIIS